MKLKYYHGALHLEFDGKVKQYHISVIAKSRKRLIELVSFCGSKPSIGFISTYFSMMDSPSVQMKDKPLEESIWIEPMHCAPLVRLWPRPFKAGDKVRFRKHHVQDIRPSEVRSVSNGVVKLDDGKVWGWSSLMLDSEWQKKQNS